MNKSNIDVPERRGYEQQKVTTADVKLFAQMTGDFNDVHLSNSAARRAGFDGAIAHGVLVEGVVSSAIADLSDGDDVVILVEKDTTYALPVLHNTTVTATAEVDTVTEGFNTAAFKATVDGETVVEGEARILFR